MIKVKIVSMNVNGLAQNLKRKKMLIFLKQKRPSIVFMQETHCVEQQESIWRSQWKGKILFSNGSSSSAGVAILFQEKFNCQILKSTIGDEGRYIIVDIKHEEEIYTLVNIYAPNIDTPEFFQQILHKLQDHENKNVIMGGDFNLVLDIALDSKNPNRNNNEKSKQVLAQCIDQIMLVDVWRFQNPGERKYTWNGRINYNQSSRIDFFLINYGMLSQTKSDILPGFASDHSIVVITVDLAAPARGKGVWKLNTSHLQNSEFINDINDKIDNAIFNISGQKPDEAWEMVKDAMINGSKEWSKQNARKNVNELKMLTRNIERLTKKLENCNETPSGHEYQKSIEVYKQRQNRHLTRVAQGAMVRSRYKWYTEGETGSAYFMNLEKVKYSNKTIKKLITNDGQILRDHKKILQAQIEFYRKLYTSNKDVYFLYTNESATKLTDEDKRDLDLPIVQEEVSNAIYNMPNNKAPGIDGIPIEMYKVFYGRIKEILYNAIRYAVQNEKMHTSARLGILSLIPKKNSPPEKLTSWRPLTLMTADHKILAKILANRIKPVLNYLIGNHQTGYLQGKFIGLNIRKLMDILYYVESENLEALLISVDFYKCFDTLEFSAIKGAMKFFNFGEYFIKMVFTLYNSFESTILYSGNLSEYFTPSRGIHQGCPISGYLYILVAEVLAINVKNNPDIKGIPIIGSDKPEVITQYVDDMYLLSLFDKSSLEAMTRELEKFHDNTGLRVNYDKTTIFRIGALKHSNRKFRTSANFKWANADINVLGIVLDDESINRNYHTIIQKMSTITQIWSQRNLSLKGKVTVLNNLVGSLLVYQMQMLPMISNIDLAKINRILEDFIWRGRKPKIRLKTLQNSTIQAGLRLFNPALKDKSIKISWVKRYQDFDENSKLLALYCIKPVITNQELWYCNTSVKDMKYLCNPTGFWKDVMTCWCEYNYHEIENIETLLHERIWINSHIRIGNKPACIREMMNHNVYEILDLIDTDTGFFYTYEKLIQIHEFKLMYLTYLSLIQAIPHKWKAMIRNMQPDLSVEIPFKLDEIMSHKRVSANAYMYMIDDSNAAIEQCTQKWTSKLGIEIRSESIKRGFQTGKLSKIAKYISFQYRLMHNVVFLNDRLFHFGKVNTQNCDFCNEHKENFTHFFVECEYVQSLWHDLWSFARMQDAILISELNLSPSGFLTNSIHPQRNHFMNVICLVTKQQIYAAKCLGKKPSKEKILNEITFIQNIEKQAANTKNQIDMYNYKWKDNKVKSM